MSHELRTPLNAISGYAQLMQLGISGPLTPEQSEQLARIQRSQQHLLGIINDILNFSRIEAGELPYDIGEVAVRDAIDVVVTMIGPQAAKKSIALAIGKCPADLVVLADRAKVEQIVLNLLSNAVKFTEPGGKIEINCTKDLSVARISVRDDGLGVPADQLEAIFAPFSQVGRSLSTPKEGTGLGLSISRDLARGMGGELEIESRVGEGSTFTLQLPRVV
jgi:signal transduction histidine kinase